MRKIILRYVIVFCCVLFLIACEKKDEYNNESDTTKIEGLFTKESDFFSTEENGVTLDIIKDDVLKQQDFISHGFNITKLDIIKRQTNAENKEDIIFMHVEATNNDFSIVRNYEMIYELYNEGWLLETCNSYTKDEYYDKTTPLHGVKEDIIKKDFESVINSELEPLFSNSFNGASYSEIENISFDNISSDNYLGYIYLDYGLFTKIVTVNIYYTLEGYVWSPLIQCESSYSLNDSINGCWSKTSGPDMVVSSHKKQVTIEKISETSCKCSYYSIATHKYTKTDTVSSFEKTDSISPRYDSDGSLYRIVLVAYGKYDNSISDYIYLTPDGIVHDYSWGVNTETILTKE